jgi:glycosyltransferase involved in cell wall biosynthesis
LAVGLKDVMRIAYIAADRGVPVNGHSGSAVHVHELALALANRGHRLTMLAAACEPDGVRLAWPTVDLGREAGLDQLRTDIAKELRAASRPPAIAAEVYSLLLNQVLAAELTLRRGDFDLIYERQSLWSLAGLRHARRENLPFFLEVNAPLLEQQQEYREIEMMEVARAIEGELLRQADRILVTSPALLDYARARGASRRSIRVLPCGVSRRMFAPLAERPHGGGSPFVVGFVGSLKPWHGIDLLLDAFVQLRRISDVYRLLIVGSGPLMPEIEDFRRRHDFESSITVIGNVAHDRVPEYLAQMDVGVAPYPPLEPFYFSPLKVWEYAAAGVPIVASASGELPSQFPHRAAALLHRPGSTRKLVAHIERIRRDPNLGRRLARRAMRVAKLHTWDRLAARIESFAAPLRKAG